MTKPIYDDIVRASLKIIGAALSRVSFSPGDMYRATARRDGRNYRSSARGIGEHSIDYTSCHRLERARKHSC